MPAAKAKIAAVIAAIAGVLFFWRRRGADGQAEQARP